MLVDDELPARGLLKLLIDWDRAGFYIACEAVDGRDALDNYHKYRPDLIIADIQMPVMDGLTLMQKIREENPEQLFIILSCHERFVYARTALKLGAFDYLIKDSIQPDDLLEALEKAKKKLPSPKFYQENLSCFNKMDSYSPRILKVMEYILQNFEKDISLDSLAKEFAIHKVHLARTFKEETGTSVYNAILNLRIEKAKQLLADSTLTVSQIIERTGFKNSQNFYVQFKKHTDASPSDYRTKL